MLYEVITTRMDREVMQTDAKRSTPATMYNDGVDFMPASASVLFGYQFKSIAALGPIVGPITAAQFGWLPAFRITSYNVCYTKLLRFFLYLSATIQAGS